MDIKRIVYASKKIESMYCLLILSYQRSSKVQKQAMDKLSCLRRHVMGVLVKDLIPVSAVARLVTEYIYEFYGECVLALPGLSAVSAIAVLSDGRLVTSHYYHTTLLVWDSVSGASLLTLSGHKSRAHTLVPLPDNKLASISWDHNVWVWDTTDGTLIQTLVGHTNLVRDLAVLESRPESRLTLDTPCYKFATASSDTTVRVWDVGKGVLMHTLVGHTSIVHILAVMPLPNMLASASYDKTVRVWDTENGALIHTLDVGLLSSLIVLPNNWLVTSMFCENTVPGVWDGVSGEYIGTGSGSESDKPFTISYDDTVLACVSDTSRQSCVLTYKGNNTCNSSMHIHNLAVLPDGKLVLGLDSVDNSIKAWDNGECQLTITAHKNRIQALHTLPSGRLVSMSEDAVNVWV